MQKVDDLIEMLFHVIGFVKKHHDKVPRSILKFYVYLNNNVKNGEFKEDKFEKLYKSCKITLLELVKDKKLIFDNETKEQEWLAKMDDLEKRILHTSNYDASSNHKWAWLEDKVVEAFEKEENFEISKEVWQMYQDEHGLVTQHQFYENILRGISERTCDKLKKLFISQGEHFFAELVETLKRRGVLFLDKSYYLIPGIAVYDIQRNFLKFREDKINLDPVTNKHEIIHAAFYNLPRETQYKLKRFLEEELAKIKMFLDRCNERELKMIHEKYKFKNLHHALSSTDEVLAFLSDPAFAQFISDLENCTLFPKRFFDKMMSKMRKREKFKTKLFEIEREVYSYYR